MKKITIILLTILLFFHPTHQSLARDIEIVGESAVLIEQKTGKILYEKNKDQKMYPASTTKIMTGLLALEYGDLNELISIGEEIEDIPGDSSTAYLCVGQKISLEELLYGLLLASGNDAANSIAVYIGNKINAGEAKTYQEAIEVFVDLMNKRAKKIGAKNTHYVNAHGYHDERHYTTALDMGIITQEAMKNERFREIIKTKSFAYTYCVDGIESQNREWENYNALLHYRHDGYYLYANGVKSGRTTQAGRCLVSSAVKEDLQVISVVFKSTEEAVWEDSKALLSLGMDHYVYHTFAEKNQKIASIGVKRAKYKDGNILEMITNRTSPVLINKSNLGKIEKQIYISKEQEKPKLFEEENITLKAPIRKGDLLGFIIYSQDGHEILKEDLLAGDSLEKRNILMDYWWFFLLLMVLVGMCIYRKYFKKGSIY